MFRPAAAARTALRPTATFTHAPRRLLSTAPKRPRATWKGRILRWGLAGGAIYAYSVSSVFAEAPKGPPPPPPADEYERPRSLLPEVHENLKRAREEDARWEAEQAARAEEEREKREAEEAERREKGGVEALEEEAGQEGAFNPETGEINWDCPCLGGMASGPCGEEFKDAFSCFVFSTEEQKGVDCLDKFKHMQTCFQKHPEIYGPELLGDDEDESEAAAPDGKDASEDEKKYQPAESEVAAAAPLDSQAEARSPATSSKLEPPKRLDAAEKTEEGEGKVEREAVKRK